MSDWPVVKVGDVVELLTGFPFKSKEYSDNGDGYKLLRGDNIVQGRLRWEDVKLWLESNLIDKHKNYWLKEGDVVLAMDRPWIEAGLKFAQITSDDLPCLLVQRTACLRAKKDLDQDFLRYLISAYNFVEYVKLVQTGTAVPHISGKQILDFEFRLPPKEIQSEIGKILRSLDKKSELNLQINQTLEQIAQAIFKSWFVDFDPVKAKIQAKQNGQDPERAAMRAISGKTDEELEQLSKKQYKQLAEIAALFPDEIEDSELGEIPKGWEPKPLSELIVLVGGGTPKRSEETFWGGDIPWFSVKDAPSDGDVFVIDTEHKITEQGLNKSSTKLLDEGVTIISARGTVGRLAMVGVPMAMNQSCYGVKPADGLGYAYNYFNLKHAVKRLKQQTHGAVFDTITSRTFEGILSVKPHKDCVKEFELLVAPMLSRIKSNLFENSYLMECRDALLPKLLSGEIPVGDTKPKSEAVA